MGLRCSIERNWIECLRVLKHGGQLASVEQEHHRLVVQIEDAGFEIRDQIQSIWNRIPKIIKLQHRR